MQNNACREHTSSNTPSAADLVASLTAEEYRNLQKFAELRLQRLRAHASAGRLLFSLSGKDLVNTVIAKFLLGELHPKKGRHLSERHRQNTNVFVHALMGAVNSELSNLVRSAEASSAHVPLDDADHEATAVELTNSDDLNSLFERRDLTHEVFRRLNEVATPSQIEIVRAMAAGALTDNDPSLKVFDRRRVHEVRQIARRIFHELESEVPEIEMYLSNPDLFLNSFGQSAGSSAYRR